MKKKVVRLNEQDIENLVKKIIKEEQLDEIGGYDSPELSSSHGQNTMEDIHDTFVDISDGFSHFNDMKFDILDDNLARETRIMLKSVQPILERYGKAWTMAEKRRLS